jgi:hypothetical protein
VPPVTDPDAELGDEDTPRATDADMDDPGRPTDPPDDDSLPPPPTDFPPKK